MIPLFFSPLLKKSFTSYENKIILLGKLFYLEDDFFCKLAQVNFQGLIVLYQGLVFNQNSNLKGGKWFLMQQLS